MPTPEGKIERRGAKISVRFHRQGPVWRPLQQRAIVDCHVGDTQQGGHEHVAARGDGTSTVGNHPFTVRGANRREPGAQRRRREIRVGDRIDDGYGRDIDTRRDASRQPVICYGPGMFLLPPHPRG
jgi:hypothetical protein